MSTPTIHELESELLASQQENERLRREAAAMREALERISNLSQQTAMTFEDQSFAACEISRNALTTNAGRDYVSREAVRPIVEALRPFAARFNEKTNGPSPWPYFLAESRREWNEKMPDFFPIELEVTMGVCRNAVAALTRARELGLLEEKP